MQAAYWYVRPFGAGAWQIERDGRVRASYVSKQQAIADARQLAAFEAELHARSGIVRVADVTGGLEAEFRHEVARRNDATPMHREPRRLNWAQVPRATRDRLVANGRVAAAAHA